MAATSSKPAANGALEFPTVAVGIDGVYRPGQWTAIKSPLTLMDPRSVQTLDGDGVKIVYEQPQAAASTWLYAVPGTTGVPLVIMDSAGNQILRDKFTGKSIEPKTPWVVVFGDTLGVEEIGRNDLLKRESTVAVSVIRRGADFPDQTIGLSGVDLIIVGPTGSDVFSQLTPQQGRTFTNWVRRGGRTIVSLGKDAAEMFAVAPWLGEIVPIDATPRSIRLDPSAIETFTSSQNRLPVLEAAALPLIGGETKIFGRNSARQPARIAVEYIIGFGRVTIVAAALDSVEFAEWPERTALISRLSGGLFDSERDARRDSRANTSVGYDDIAGQVRAALDRFDSRRRVPFSVISVILISLVALIGPLDYLLVNRLLGRPLLGWITFPLSVLLVSGLLMTIGRPAANESGPGPSKYSAAGTEPQLRSTPLHSVEPAAHVNRMEIVDIDSISSPPIGRGWSWTSVSSVDAIKADYPARMSAAFFDFNTKHSLVSAPFGYSGATYGGISIVGEDTRLPTYQVKMSIDSDNEISSEITNIPLPPGGSKSIVSRWTFTPKLSGQSNLSRRRGSELLAGSLTNSLPVDLLNGALVFGEWVYLLPTRLRAGQRIENVETLRQKNFRWLLARREAIENSSRSEPWNVEMHDDFVRLSELLMFNTICGGRDYTGLANRPLADLDLGYVLSQETAMLYGQLEAPALEINLPVERQSNSAIRVVLKVDLPKLTITSP